MANLMLSVMGAFAEFERALIRERQREGIAIARQRGAYRGRKRSLSDEKLAELHRRVAAGERKAVIARDLGSAVKPYTSISARPTDAHVLIMSIKSLSGAQTLR
jgi:DNA invertase Pin-like site-specific DNA recombinase